MSSIILTGGGTAGHCIPNVALLPSLKQKFDKIYYIGSENGIEKRIIEKENVPYYSVDTAKLIRSFSLKNLTVPYHLIKGISQAEKIIKEVKPSVIFSKGGFVSVPVVIAGKRQNVPIVIHESDLSVGLANKICSRYSTKFLTSFLDTANNVKNGVYVGPPIREKLSEKKYSDKYSFKNKKPVLLVFGGSQGATAINKFVYDNIDNILSEYNLIHICGKNNLNDISRDDYIQVEYEERMEYVYSITDYAVSRAGSNSAFELLYLKIPTLFIPLPKNCSRGDQIDNAKFFLSKGVCKVLYQENLTKDTFFKALHGLQTSNELILGNISKLNLQNGNRNILNVLFSYLP